MHSLSRHASHTKYRGEQVGAGAQMLDRPEKFHTVALFLQRIVRRGGALHLNLVRFQLKGLLCLRRQHESTVYDQGGANILLCDLLVIIQAAPLKYDLQGFKAAAVIQLDKAEVFHVADGSDPAADSELLTVKRRCVCIDTGDFLTLHIGTHPFFVPLGTQIYNFSVFALILLLYLYCSFFATAKIQKISLTGAL